MAIGVIKLNCEEMGRGIGKEKDGVGGEEVLACFLWGRRELLRISIMRNHKELLHPRILFMAFFPGRLDTKMLSYGCER